MEDIDGGLHPAVDGQSLDDDEMKMISMSSLSAWFVMYFVFPLCVFKPTFRLSEFRLFRCFSGVCSGVF